MAGISSHALMKLENKRGYNGNEIQDKEFSDGSGLELYDFNARTYDQQIGRFIQVDPFTDEGGQESLSPYHFSYNNPIRYSDPDGREPEDGPGPKGYWAGVGEGFKRYFDNVGNKIKSNFENPVQTIKEGLNPTNALNELKSLSPVSQLIDNTKVAVSVINNLAEGNNYEAGQITGAKTAEGVHAGIVVAATAGIAKGVKVGIVGEAGKEIGILNDAAKGKGNFSLGQATTKTSDKLGNAWVGEGAKVASVMSNK